MLLHERSRGDLEKVPLEVLARDFLLLESHHGSQAPDSLCKRLRLWDCMPRWNCGKCQYTHERKEKGCWHCGLVKSEAMTAKPHTEKSTWGPFNPQPKDAAKDAPKKPPWGDKKAKDTATSPSAAKPAIAALPVRCQTTTSPAQTGSGSATSNAPMEVKQLEADEPIFAENQAQWEQLTKEISRNQGLLSGVKSMAGEDAEQRRQELQTRLTDLFARRTNLKNALQRVSTLT